MASHPTVKLVFFDNLSFLRSFVSQSFGFIRWWALVVGLLSIYCPLLASAEAYDWAFMLNSVYYL
jgi:hypothetical protein